MMVSTSILILAILSANSCRICSTIINYLFDLKHSQQKDSPSELPVTGAFLLRGVPESCRHLCCDFAQILSAHLK